VAFRTFNISPIAIKDIEDHFFELGYQVLEDYEFAEKKLKARAYIHPQKGLNSPRLFLSELKVEELSEASQKIIKKICAQIKVKAKNPQDFFTSGVLWNPITYSDYQVLLAESEYAAWLATIGIRVNHFTISINHLKNHHSVADVIHTVEEQGLSINSAGGKIKGTAQDLLEQASTLADKISYVFAGGETHEIPSCYYEFAKRYKDESGKIYEGFIPASADKIFESTFVKGKK
jgi:hypothetical protein